MSSQLPREITTAASSRADISSAASGEAPDHDLSWRDPSRSPAERAAALIPQLTLEEKLAQLVGVWVGADASGGDVAPCQSDLADGPLEWESVIKHGLGQLTRPFGSAPVAPGPGAKSLASSQAQIVATSRFGIPALVHEECLTGFAAWRATVFPAPLCWGAAFDPDLVRQMAHRIGRSMRSAGVHQGLAPVLDVTRDYRWGRTEETIGEDPYLVGTVGSAYVRGLEDSGIVSTLKHFAGYSASRAARNLAPVQMGSRELADVILPPFEMALRLGGARSVMNSYAEIDGVPVAANPELLTRLLREEWGFQGTVVADYFAVRFLESLHRVAGDPVSAAQLALRAGIDVELPTVDTFGQPLVDAVRAGQVDEALIDRALHRVLAQKAELGLLDPDWDPVGPDLEDGSFNDSENQELALRLARQSVVLVRNTERVLPLTPGRRVALVGPVADDPLAMMGCYAFPIHVGTHHPHLEMGLEVPSLRQALGQLVDGLVYEPGCSVSGDDTSGFAAAVEAAREADVCVLAIGDRAGLFGRGTSGEGCDASDLTLPGVQAQLVARVLETGTPVVLVLLAGRPYAMGPEVEAAAGIVTAFFPGQCGGTALAEVLTGVVSPSGRLPVSISRNPGSMPATYLAPPLGQLNGVSCVDPTPAYGFGHGLTYTSFEWDDAVVIDPSGGVDAGSLVAWPVDGEVTVAVTVRNTGQRAGTEVVQLYLHDPVAQTTRPVNRLVGYTRVDLEPGAAARVAFAVPADVTSFTGVAGQRIVEPGLVELRFGRSCLDLPSAVRLELVGAQRQVGHERELVSTASVERVRGLADSAQEA